MLQRMTDNQGEKQTQKQFLYIAVKQMKRRLGLRVMGFGRNFRLSFKDFHRSLLNLNLIN